MMDNCLDDKAKFRYVGEKLQHNEATLFVPTSGYENRVLVYEGKGTNRNQYETRQNTKQTDGGYLFFYDPDICAKSATQYVLRELGCNSREQKVFTFGKIVIWSYFPK